MSVLSLPRLYINGHVYWNPSTYNNNDYAGGDPSLDQYDQDNAKLNWAQLNEYGVKTDAQFKKWSVEVFPAKPNSVPPAEWSYYGGNQCGFVTESMPDIRNPDFTKPSGVTHVTGYTDASGKYHDSNSNDPWMKQPVQLNVGKAPAKLVDINPVSPWSSQIFTDSFTLGQLNSDNKPECGFSAPTVQRMYSRWIYFQHNYKQDQILMIAGGLSAVFQTCFETGSIQWGEESTALQTAFQDALYSDFERKIKRPTVAGLMLRFTTYDTLYFRFKAFEKILGGTKPGTDEGLNKLMAHIATLYQEYIAEMKKYTNGEITEKPLRPIDRAYSRMVGWVGLWETGELASVPDGRMLVTSQPVAPAKPSGLTHVPLGPAVVDAEIVEETVTRLTVDLGTAMPELDSTGTKADFGTVQLVLMKGDDPVPIYTLPNDQATYEQFAGVVDIPASDFINPITPVDISDNNNAFAITVNDNQVALKEAQLTAQTDQRGVYADEPGPDYTDDDMPTFTIKVQHQGGSPPAGTQLGVAQYDEGWGLVAEDGNSGSASAPYVSLFYKHKIGSDYVYTPIDNNTAIEVPPGIGLVTIAVRALRPGMPNLEFFPFMPGKAFQDPPKSAPAGGDPASTFYTVVRVLPFDNQLAASFKQFLTTNPDIDLVNHRVFNDVYKTFHLIFPVMDFIYSPQKFQEWRGPIEMVTDPALFDSASYMPVTRSFSAGKRSIVEMYCEYANTLPPESPLASKQEAGAKFHR